MVEQALAITKAIQYANEDNQNYVVFKNTELEKVQGEINQSFDWCSESDWKEMENNPKYQVFKFISLHVKNDAASL